MGMSMSFISGSSSSVASQSQSQPGVAVRSADTVAEGFFNVRVYDENGKPVSGNIPVLGQDITPYEWGTKRAEELKDEASKTLHNAILQRIKNYINNKNFEKELPMGTWEVPFVIAEEDSWEERWIVVKVFFHINTKKYSEYARTPWKTLAYSKK